MPPKRSKKTTDVAGPSNSSIAKGKNPAIGIQTRLPFTSVRSKPKAQDAASPSRSSGSASPSVLEKRKRGTSSTSTAARADRNSASRISTPPITTEASIIDLTAETQFDSAEVDLYSTPKRRKLSPTQQRHVPSCESRIFADEYRY